MLLPSRSPSWHLCLNGQFSADESSNLQRVSRSRRLPPTNLSALIKREVVCSIQCRKPASGRDYTNARNHDWLWRSSNKGNVFFKNRWSVAQISLTERFPILLKNRRGKFSRGLGNLTFNKVHNRPDWIVCGCKRGLPCEYSNQQALYFLCEE